jgi:hypothetical protein
VQCPLPAREQTDQDQSGGVADAHRQILPEPRTARSRQWSVGTGVATPAPAPAVSTCPTAAPAADPASDRQRTALNIRRDHACRRSS